MKRHEPELKLDIDRHLQWPIYLQICERFKSAVASGALQPGDRVPAVRGLATELSTARGTIEMAYRILVDEGYLEVRGAAGTFVSASLPQSVTKSRTAAATNAATRKGVRRMNDAKHHAQATADPTGTPLLLRPGLPALDAFPQKAWNRLLVSRLRSAGMSALAYPDPRGYELLREKIATYLALSRGVECTPDQVIVTSGHRAILELALRGLNGFGAQMWFEDPGYLLARRFLLDLGTELVPVPVDGEGMVVQRGVELCPHARFALVTPSHQSPLGVSLSLARRLALLDWAARENAWIIEDDYDSEFRYVGRPLPALKSLDRHDRVIYCGTFSKAMFPGLRLAYMVVPKQASERILAACHGVNVGSPHLLQAGVADFIANGHFARHLKRMRALYAERRALMADALQRAFGERVEVRLPAGGMHLVMTLDRATPGADVRFAQRAHAAGFGVLPLSVWYADAKSKHALSGLVLGFANVADAKQAARLAARLKQAYDA